MNINLTSYTQQNSLTYNLSKIVLGASLMLASSLTLFASENSNGSELFAQKCGICHPMKRPADKSTMIAPPAMGLMFHMSEDIGSDDKILAHINNFVMNPTKEKAICPSVKRFGLMPSQKDVITKKELDIVAKWMIQNLKMTEKQYKRRKARDN